MFRKVREFHRRFGAGSYNGSNPRAVFADRAELRCEEWAEYQEAINAGDLVRIAHEACDLIYVVLGDLETLGVDADAVFDEIHRANMAKLWPDGEPRYRPSDGKVLKPPDFAPADVAGVLDRTSGRAAPHRGESLE